MYLHNKKARRQRKKLQRLNDKEFLQRRQEAQLRIARQLELKAVFDTAAREGVLRWDARKQNYVKG